MPQPKKPASSSARKPAAAKKPAARGGAGAKRSRSSGAAAKNAAARTAATKLNAPRRKAPARKAAAPTPDDVVATLGALRERLVSSLTLTSDRLQETVDDAVRRGRMTRKDAE